MFCKNCGSEVTPNEKYCHSCGCQITEEVSPVNGDSNDSKNAVNKKSSGLKKSSKIIIASVLAVVLLSGIAAAGIRLGVKMANKSEENEGGASAADSVDPSEIRTFNSLLEDDNYWVPVKVEKTISFDGAEDLYEKYEYDWYENEVKIKVTYNTIDSNVISYLHSVGFDNDGKISSEKSSGEHSADITYEYENGLLSNTYGIEINRDSKGKIAKIETTEEIKGSTCVEFKYSDKKECGICASDNSKPLFSAVYKYDNNDGINLNLTDLEILDKEWAEEYNIGKFKKPYTVLSLDFNDSGIITRFSMNNMKSNEESNYLFETTEDGYYSEYNISHKIGGRDDTYRVYWERGTKAQERIGLTGVFSDVVLDYSLIDISYPLLYCMSFLFPAGESVF